MWRERASGKAFRLQPRASGVLKACGCGSHPQLCAQCCLEKDSRAPASPHGHSLVSVPSSSGTGRPGPPADFCSRAPPTFRVPAFHKCFCLGESLGRGQWPQARCRQEGQKTPTGSHRPSSCPVCPALLHLGRGLAGGRAAHLGRQRWGSRGGSPCLLSADQQAPGVLMSGGEAEGT